MKDETECLRLPVAVTQAHLDLQRARPGADGAGAVAAMMEAVRAGKPDWARVETFWIEHEGRVFQGAAMHDFVDPHRGRPAADARPFTFTLVFQLRRRVP